MKKAGFALLPSLLLSVCVFTNRDYAGACRESVDAEDPAAACAEVLDCLNDVLCMKAYCMATPLRRGWELDSIEEEADGRNDGA